MPGSLWKSFRANCSLFLSFQWQLCAKYLVSGRFWYGGCNFWNKKWSKLPKTTFVHPTLRLEHWLTSSPGSFCPSPIPPTPGQPCNLPGALDCHYKTHIDNHGLAGNCCCGQCDIDMTCAPNSTDGSGLWQPKHPMLCPTKGCGREGECRRETVKQFNSFLDVNLIEC